MYNMLGGLQEANKDLANAEGNLKKAIELAPNLPALQISLANFYMRQKMVDKAKSQYSATLEKSPNDLSAHMALGMIYESEKDFTKAQASYEKVLQINPNFPPAANNLAYLYAERGGNIDMALNLAQKAKEQAPDDPHISDTLGWIYYKKNVPSRAVVLPKRSGGEGPERTDDPIPPGDGLLQKRESGPGKKGAE